MNTHTELAPLKVRRVMVIGVAQWKYEYASLAEAAECVQTLAERIAAEGTRLDFIEVMVEFATGESERCAFKEPERVYAWMKRFE
jgi:hypothetical protein